MKDICVFCSSSEDLSEDYYILADELGVLLGKNKMDLIHGAGTIGLMGALMKSAAAAGCFVTGVVPERLNRKNIVSDKLQKLVITTDMKDRKEYMRSHSDAFIALPGGFGTLEELLETITLKQLKYHSKPIIILNHKGFYDKLLEQLEVFYNEDFANPSYRELYFVAKTSTEAIDYIKKYVPKNIYDKYLGA
ncbi:MAG: TIGR00730 family Rossman fold protein [Bacteroidales bacterium]|nr:TIGR00730 family Rossman fold protein [Bacteroidales bacterium]MDD4217731.1 TIGR00730 family Rossman fold protein [Bacteroidales bacterium]MDY0140450.1 TIGR00730 family Rossman fold protein [Bacteroidales bacterium]